MHNYFSIFNLDSSFKIDKELLEQRYQLLLTKIHPDNFAKASSLAKEIAQNSTARINTAYQTLLCETSRASHLLELEGFALSEKDKVEDAEFLGVQFELQESLHAMQTLSEKQKFKQDIKAKVSTLFANIEKDFASSNFASAKQGLLKINYYKNLLQSKQLDYKLRSIHRRARACASFFRSPTPAFTVNVHGRRNLLLTLEH